MLFWNKICGLTAIFFLCTLFSAAQITYYNKSKGDKVSDRVIFKPAFISQYFPDKEIFINKPLKVIPHNYYTQHLGIICKKELALEKAIRIPFKFRIGTLQHCNYLEGKK